MHTHMLQHIPSPMKLLRLNSQNQLLKELQILSLLQFLPGVTDVCFIGSLAAGQWSQLADLLHSHPHTSKRQNPSLGMTAESPARRDWLVGSGWSGSLLQAGL